MKVGQKVTYRDLDYNLHTATVIHIDKGYKNSGIWGRFVKVLREDGVCEEVMTKHLESLR